MFVLLLFSVCQQETYKAETGDGPCLPCPPFSQGPDYGLTECRCIPGYYRSPTDPRNMSCTRKWIECFGHNNLLILI